jgi:hypothetical protein
VEPHPADDGAQFRQLKPGWGEQLRNPTEPGQAMGLSDRAREVESNLGVR